MDEVRECFKMRMMTSTLMSWEMNLQKVVFIHYFYYLHIFSPSIPFQDSFQFKLGNISFNAHHDKPPTAEETALLKLISNKNQLTQADLSDLLRGNYEEDEECNSDLDLEDLKSLK